jgi:large subunit ribosomal protein L31
MKPGIHPRYVEATVSCACGNVFTTRSTKPQLRTDLCNVCHPFYTGEQRIVDTAGQVERFMKRLESVSGDARPSKRKQRLSARAEREAEAKRRAEEAAKAQAAEEAAARAAARAAAASEVEAAQVESGEAAETAPVAEAPDAES